MKWLGLVMAIAGGIGGYFTRERILPMPALPPCSLLWELSLYSGEVMTNGYEYEKSA